MARLIASLLYGIKLFDVVTFAAVSVFLAAVALLAAICPRGGQQQLIRWLP
jgi:hypothetical protein